MFIDNVLTVLANKKITRTDLARMLGMCPQQLGRYINRKEKPSFRTKKKICDALEIPYTKMENEVIEREFIRYNIVDTDGVTHEYLPVHKRIAENLPKLMKEKKVTIADLHRKTGVSRGAISGYMRGTNELPSLYNMRLIADALEVSVGKILN